MAENKTILELNEVTANASGDVFPLVQGGVTQKTTLSKIKTFFDSIYTTTSAVASQISAALTGYATTTQLNAGLASKQNKQSLTVTNINADPNQPTSTLTSENCILSITNIPSGTGNKTITIECSGVLLPEDLLSFTVKYAGYSVNLRSYSIIGDENICFLSLYLNIHSNPTEPVIISMNKIN